MDNPTTIRIATSCLKWAIVVLLLLSVSFPPALAQEGLPAPSPPQGVDKDVNAILDQRQAPESKGDQPLPLYPQPQAAVSEDIPLVMPPADKLLPLAGKLPPIKLEASYTQPVSLRECLQYAFDNNLPIRITREDMTSKRWLWLGALGKFLPNMIMNFQSQILAGSSLVGGLIPVSFHTPNASAQAGFQFYGFRGGGVLFGSLSAMHTWKASKAALSASINDVLLQVARLYYELMRNEALLQVQTVAVEISRAQLLLNQQLETAGTGTHFNVLQAETQLARDEQDLLVREVGLRNAAINLGVAMNANLSVNLLSMDTTVKKVRLVDPALHINDLLGIAIDNRPELRQFEELRIAARRNIQVAAAPLYPQFQFFGNVVGNGATLNRSLVISPGSLSTVPAGPPIAGVTANNSQRNPSPVFPAGLVFNPATVTNRQMKKSYSMGVRVDWNYPSAGVPDLANVQSARAIARQTALQANQTLLNVLSQVRQSYLNSQTAEKLIDVASAQVVSSGEQYRLAKVRLTNGVGINLDVIQAQQQYTQALASKANAIIDFNIAQVQLVRDMGIITVDNLTSGRLINKKG